MSTSVRTVDAVTERVGAERDSSPVHRRTPKRTPGHPGASPAASTAPHQPLDASARDDPVPEGRLLSVAEIQQALRELRAHRRAAPPEVPTQPSTRPHNRQSRRERGDAPRRGDGSRGRTTAARGPDEADRPFPSGWVTVVAAHAGAGASTVALAIGEAAAAADRRVHLIETAAPARSGLVAAASVELGSDATGRWRRGNRPGVTIDRRADVESSGWPTPPVGDRVRVTVVDLGMPAAADLARLATAGVRAVVVCRATVPGVRATEQLLGQLAGLPIVVAVLGARRWPGAVTASLGRRLWELRAAGRVVAVPTDRRLEITGPGPLPLPRPVRAAGRALWQMLVTEGPGAADERASVVSPPRGADR